MNVSFANPCRNTQNEDGDTRKGTQMNVGPKKTWRRKPCRRESPTHRN